ncbi:hypothetical protein DFO79_1112 [Pseudidiomarina tainanensis]|uniref:Uncharacterized protein n=2 Tax=Pseudidiomarina TaxID=2800384 RepID=A0A368US66_9GAMM|nr:hypothetical protein DET45_1102 [Pseudidiomarina maritima]RBP88884.1 hypothetical protein DFO81_1122 [Pseudidiomarina tainanensis]RCW30870.1 hypothetical protein DFO79_1112 [Pseudidiomarina tainanensis]
MEARFVVRLKYIILTIIVLLQGCGESGLVDIYYDGFWTKHRVYQSEAQLEESAKIKITKLDIKLLSDEASTYLFDNFGVNNKAKIPEDIVFMALIRSLDGKLERKIIGDSIYLYDVTNNLFKVLDDDQKDYLRCFFTKHASEPVIDEKLESHCAKYN